MQKKIDRSLWMFTLILIIFFVPARVSAQGKKCPKAEDLDATEITEHSAKLTWRGHEDILSYQVDLKQGPGELPFSYTSSVTFTEITAEGLSPGTVYRFRVMTTCDPASGGSSNWFDFTTSGEQTIDSTENETDTIGMDVPQSAGPCPKPSNLAILEINDTSALLAWLGNVENMVYQVDVHQKEHTPVYRISEMVDTNLLFISGLKPGGNYKFRVKARCEKSSSGSSSWINFTTTGGDTVFQSCPKPVNLSVPLVTETSALLTWVAKDTVSAFQLDVKSYQGTPSFDLSIQLSSDSYWVNRLVPGGHYQFRVIAICTDGSQSGSSDWSKFRTLSDSTHLDTLDTESPEGETEPEPEGDPGEETEGEPGPEEPEDTVENESELFSVEIAAFPNPAVEQINIELPVKELGFLTYISLSDMFGRVVYQTSLHGPPSKELIPLPVNTLRNGIYKLVVKSVDFHRSKTIVVQH